MKLSIIGNTYKINIYTLEKAAEAAFSLLPSTNGEIELKIVSRKLIRALNKEYREIDQPTDVLSFNVSEKPLMGQIFICYTIARQQANELEKSLDNEIAFLLVHGILHVFGYDHMSEKDAVAMEALENKIVNIKGV